LTRVEDAVGAGYAACEAATRSSARNFALGIWLLPPDRRRALAAVYWFAHRADEAVDGPGDPTERRVRLASVREELDRTVAGQPPSAPWTALADATERWAIPTGLYHELVDGVARDLEPARFPDWKALRDYCHGVAGVVGLMALRIFAGRGDGAPGAAALDPTVQRAAARLGYALQLTNILRDLREDACRGRWYLPLDESELFGVTEKAVAAGATELGFDALIALQIERARDLYTAGPRLVRHLPRMTRLCPAALTGVYRGILERIAAEPRAILRERVGLPPAGKLARGLAAAAHAVALRAA
jgi:phytoene synthase